MKDARVGRMYMPAHTAVRTIYGCTGAKLCMQHHGRLWNVMRSKGARSQTLHAMQCNTMLRNVMNCQGAQAPNPEASSQIAIQVPTWCQDLAWNAKSATECERVRDFLTPIMGAASEMVSPTGQNMLKHSTSHAAFCALKTDSRLTMEVQTLLAFRNLV
eukprot:743493-Pelagomonas_calceolata.AAC.5